jgi:hypothetical protein
MGMHSKGTIAFLCRQLREEPFLEKKGVGRYLDNTGGFRGTWWFTSPHPDQSVHVVKFLNLVPRMHEPALLVKVTTHPIIWPDE